LDTTGTTFTKKECKVCRESKDDSLFRVSNKKTGNRRTECRECERSKSRANSFKYTRGITYEERDAVLIEQGLVCKACGKDTPGSKKGWHVDHCHRSGKIRGVLCANCNVALGQVNDSIKHLKQLIRYLEDNK
jgi:hypothetical protein